VLHHVGLTDHFISRMHGHTNIKFPSSWFNIKGAGSSKMLHPRKLTLISEIFEKLRAGPMEAEHCHLYGGKCHWNFSILKLDIILKWRYGASCGAQKRAIRIVISAMRMGVKWGGKA